MRNLRTALLALFINLFNTLRAGASKPLIIHSRFRKFRLPEEGPNLIDHTLRFLFSIISHRAFLLFVSHSIAVILTIAILVFSSFDRAEGVTYIECGENYAYQFPETGQFVPCADFDEYSLSIEVGEVRKELELRVGGKNGK